MKKILGALLALGATACSSPKPAAAPVPTRLARAVVALRSGR